MSQFLNNVQIGSERIRFEVVSSDIGSVRSEAVYLWRAENGFIRVVSTTDHLRYDVFHTVRVTAEADGQRGTATSTEYEVDAQALIEEALRGLPAFEVLSERVLAAFADQTRIPFDAFQEFLDDIEEI